MGHLHGEGDTVSEGLDMEDRRLWHVEKDGIKTLKKKKSACQSG